jgi:polysaccharide biosynthesis/export protein
MDMHKTRTAGIAIGIVLAIAAVASAQTRNFVKVVKNQSIIWRLSMPTPMITVNAGTVLEVVGREGEWYVVRLSEGSGFSAGDTGRIAPSQVERVDSGPVAAPDGALRRPPQRPVGRAEQPASARDGSAAPEPPVVRPPAAPDSAAAVVPPPGYVIGVNDVLAVSFWQEKDLSADVTVRPDGNISLPLLNDVPAAGRTPQELRAALIEAASRFIDAPNPTVAVKQINSRNVFLAGNVMKPGSYPLLDETTTVLQLISRAGGLRDFADDRNIIVIRSENGRQSSYRVNYREVVKRGNLKQNMTLKAGDTVVVP